MLSAMTLLERFISLLLCWSLAGPRAGRVSRDSGTDVLEKALEFGRGQDDRPRRHAQAIDGLGGQDERCGLLIQIVQLRLVLQRRERHVDGIDLGIRDAQRAAVSFNSSTDS